MPHNSMPHEILVYDNQRESVDWAQAQWPYTRGVSWCWRITTSILPHIVQFQLKDQYPYCDRVAFRFADRGQLLQLRQWCHEQGFMMERPDLIPHIENYSGHSIMTWPHMVKWGNPPQTWAAIRERRTWIIHTLGLGADREYHEWLCSPQAAYFVDENHAVETALMWG